MCVCAYICRVVSFWPSALKGFPYIEMQLLPFIPKKSQHFRRSRIVRLFRSIWNAQCSSNRRKRKKMARGQRNSEGLATRYLFLCVVFRPFFSVCFLLCELCDDNGNGLSLDCSASLLLHLFLCTPSRGLSMACGCVQNPIQHITSMHHTRLEM